MLVQDGLRILLALAAGRQERVSEGSAADEVTALLSFFLLGSRRRKTPFKFKASVRNIRGESLVVESGKRRNLCLNSYQLLSIVLSSLQDQTAG